MKNNLVTLFSRILTQYIQGMSCLSKAVPQHIMHKCSNEMSLKSEVIILDILMKNENCHSDMIEIMTTMQGYLGNDHPSDKRVASGGDTFPVNANLEHNATWWMVTPPKIGWSY